LERLHRQLEQAEPDESLRRELVQLWRLRRQRRQGVDGTASGSRLVAAGVAMVVCAKRSPQGRDS
jgi:hypothetical protein